VCDFITKGTTPPGTDSPRVVGDVPFIKVQHLSGTGRFQFSESPSFVSRSVHDGFLRRSKVFPNDVLMNIVGPPLGQVSVVPGTFPEWNVNQAIAIFRSISGLSNKLLATWLLSRPVIVQALTRTKTTAGQVNLTLEVCRDLVIPLPPLAEQEAIIDAVEDQLSVIEHLEAEFDSQLKNSKALRQVMLSHAFTGELVPQDATDEPASALLERIAAEREHCLREVGSRRGNHATNGPGDYGPRRSKKNIIKDDRWTLPKSANRLGATRGCCRMPDSPASSTSSN
jgi:type I restriction enzyme S subunit